MLRDGSDMFLKLDGIEGESVDAKHEGEIDVISFTGPNVCRTTPDAQPSFATVTISKFTDKATPYILEAAVSGKHIKDGKLTVRKGGDKTIDYLVFEFQDISILTAGDSFTFSAENTKVTYTPQKADGTPGPGISTGWDIGGN